MYHSYNVPVSNSFSVLAGPLESDSNLESPSSIFQPVAHSSPQTDDHASQDFSS